MGLVSMSANGEAPRPGTEGPFKVEATDIVTGATTPYDDFANADEFDTLVAGAPLFSIESHPITGRSPEEVERSREVARRLNRAKDGIEQDKVIRLLPEYDTVIRAGSKHGDVRYVIGRLVEAGASPLNPVSLIEGEKWVVTAETLDTVRRRLSITQDLMPDAWYALEGMVTVGMLGDHEAVPESYYVQLNAQIRHDALVNERFAWRSADEEARQRLKKRDLIEPPSGVTLTELLAESDEPVQYRIDDLWPSGGRVLVAAQRKAGKTTMSANIVKSVLDGNPFLGAYQVQPVCEGSVALLDFEMGRQMLRVWYRDLVIENTDNLYVWPMRGMGAAFDVRDKDTRAQWVKQLQAIECKVLIVDCLAPIFSAIGVSENSNDELGPFLGGLDALMVEAGVEEMMVIHHMGHGGERARGGSRLLDWGDANWKIVRERDAKTGETIDASARFFSADGRDVLVEECALTFDKDQRLLVVNPEGQTRADVKKSAIDKHAMEAATIVYMAGKALGVGDIKVKMRSGNNTEQTKAIKRAVDSGLLVMEQVGRTHMHSTGPNYPVETSVQMDWVKNQGS